jgi:CRISPR system Cascade subunit CasA
MTAVDSITAGTSMLFGSLLREQLLNYRLRGTGERIAATLPEIFVAMAKDQVQDFPVLRTHQRHAWHAFLVQLAAIALHRSAQVEPYETEQEWSAALLALTPNDADGAAWCLVSPVNRPAFLQAPVLAGLDAKWEIKTTADQIDIIKVSKNHDLKAQRMIRASVEDWIYALVSLQTQTPGDSGSYKESSRMDGGWGRRPGIGIVPPGGYGARWRRDLKILLSERNAISEKYSFNQHGVSLAWLVPWDGAEKSMLSVTELDPFYIEVTRRIRMICELSVLVAKTTTTPNSRIRPFAGGLTGDIWSPIGSDKDGPKVITIRPSGLNYRTAVRLLVPGDFEFSPAMKLQRSDPTVGLSLHMESVAWGPKNTNAGYHSRDVRIGKKLAAMLAVMKKNETDALAAISKSRVEQIDGVGWMLKQALMVLFTSDSDSRSDTVKERANRFYQPFDAKCDSNFFPELIEEFEADDREDVRTKWLRKLADRAERVLNAAFAAGPRSGQLRYRAQSAAVTCLNGLMRSDKSKLPALAQALKNRKPPFTSTHEESHEHA